MRKQLWENKFCELKTALSYLFNYYYYFCSLNNVENKRKHIRIVLKNAFVLGVLRWCCPKQSVSFSKVGVIIKKTQKIIKRTMHWVTKMGDITNRSDYSRILWLKTLVIFVISNGMWWPNGEPGWRATYPKWDSNLGIMQPQPLVLGTGHRFQHKPTLHTSKVHNTLPIKYKV